MNRLWIAIVTASLTLAGCSAEEGSTIRINNVPARDASCFAQVSSTTHWSSGFYDPRGTSTATPAGYILDLNLTNHTQDANNDPAVNTDKGTLRPNANAVTVLGFDVCWFRADPESGNRTAIEFDAFGDGVPESLRCENLPNSQKGFTAAHALIEPNGGEAVLSIQLFSPEVLRSLYGAEFEPWSIPDQGFLADDLGNWYYSYLPQSPTPPRNANWGNYASDVEARLIVQVRAVGKLQSGSSVHSNWFVFPVDICVGCSADVCGALLLQDCSQSAEMCPNGTACPPVSQCSDGSTCLPGATCDNDGGPCPQPTCSNGSTCDPGTWAFSGGLPSLTDACLPFQNNSTLSCETLTGCGAAAP